MGAKGVEPRLVFLRPGRAGDRARAQRGPLFIFSYLAANHFPWDFTYRPDLTPDWRNLGNAPNVDEYVRRQGMSERDYAAFLARLRRDFPDESFMLVRFGDHQPDFADRIIDPTLNDDGRSPTGWTITIRAISPPTTRSTPSISNRSTCPRRSPRWKRPICRWSSRKRPACRSIRPSPSRRRSCNAADGLFYGCADGAEARRFNRLLIDAGLIKGL